jgi:crotonobetainyl-CoA:carnitine CoA-transferase CaiB-like acyl-CoA transferase
VVQRVDSNLLNGGIMLSSEWFTRYAGKPMRRLADKGQYGLDACHRLYQAHDGWLYVAAATQEERLALCRALDCDAAGYASASVPEGCHPAETPLADALAQRIAALSLYESLARLHQAGVPCAPAVAGHSEIFLDDLHAAANDMVATDRHPVIGRMRVARHYVRFGNTAVVPGRPTPLLGEQTRQVLEEVGYTEPAMAELYAKGVVKTEVPVPEGSLKNPS